MGKRTIAEAREALDRMTLSPVKRREYEKYLKQHVNREVARVHKSQMDSYRKIDGEVSEVKSELGDVEQQLYDLEKESRSRDVSASEYRSRFDDLQARRERLLQRATSLQTQVDKVIEVDEDPEAHLDSLYVRYPSIRPEFPW